jgi:hypothetical protein
MFRKLISYFSISHSPRFQRVSSTLSIFAFGEGFLSSFDQNFSPDEFTEMLIEQ